MVEHLALKSICGQLGLERQSRCDPAVIKQPEAIKDLQIDLSNFNCCGSLFLLELPKLPIYDWARIMTYRLSPALELLYIKYPVV